MNKNVPVVLAAIAFLGLSRLASADEFYMIIAVDGATSSTEYTQSQRLTAWGEDYADPRLLTYDAAFASIDWRSEGLTELPVVPYPNTTPDTIRLSANLLTDISGLSGITDVSSRLNLGYNDLTTLAPLADLVSVGSFFTLDNNDLATLEGLENFTGANYVSIFGNPSLEDVSALQNASGIGDLRIDNRQYTTRMPMASPLCQSISNTTTSLRDSGGSSLPITHVCE